jgi:UDP-3-O-[3-hydroxymyristoyl] glucosamine N-acyltransferase
MPGSSYVLAEVLADLGITPNRVHGDTRAQFNHPATVWAAGAGAIAFCLAGRVEDPEQVLTNSAAAVILTNAELNDGFSVLSPRAVVVLDDPRLAYVEVLNYCFRPEPPPVGVHPTAVVDSSATLADSCSIGPNVVIGAGSSVGAHAIVGANVVIGANVRIGARSIIGPGSVLGFDGFGYTRSPDGTANRFPHYGGVLVGDDVEIGSNTSVDRGTLGDTVIENGAKIDNLVHIAHNVRVGAHAFVIAHAMIGGSTTIGARTWVAPGVSIRDGIAVGDDALVGLGSVVTKPVSDGQTVVGSPALPIAEFKRFQAVLKRAADDRLPVGEVPGPSRPPMGPGHTVTSCHNRRTGGHGTTGSDFGLGWHSPYQERLLEVHV